MAPDVRRAAPSTSRRSHRQPTGWLLLLALAGCLNPQPDPFPQNADVDAPNSPPRRNGPNDVQFAPSTPPSNNAPAGAGTTPSVTGNEAPERPPAPRTAPQPTESGAAPDAGVAPPDAGGEFDAGVPANGF